MFAVLVYFWPRWRRLLTVSGESPSERLSPRQFLTMLILATAATGIVALGLKFAIEQVVLVRILKYPKGEVEELFKHLPIVAAGLAAVGVVILIAGSRRFERSAESPAASLNRRSSLWIGAVQGLCVPFRGFSRSGATISTGLFCGVPRALAEDFSFALALVLTPPVQVYSLYKLLKAHALTTGTVGQLLTPGLFGMILSFAAGLVALRFLSAVLERGRWMYFGFYCLVAAVAIFGADFLLPPV
jgi:undecaprenyl-diphosphatase